MANGTRPRGRRPAGVETPSLRFALRFSSQELRRDLAVKAEQQGRSMNVLINEALARSLGWSDDVGAAPSQA
jgi:predicted HicB family RNase H-like nuclease